MPLLLWWNGELNWVAICMRTLKWSDGSYFTCFALYGVIIHRSGVVYVSEPTVWECSIVGFWRTFYYLQVAAHAWECWMPNVCVVCCCHPVMGVLYNRFGAIGLRTGLDGWFFPAVLLPHIALAKGFFCGLNDAVLVDSIINCCRASFADFRDLLFAPSYLRVRACYCIPVWEGFIRSLRWSPPPSNSFAL